MLVSSQSTNELLMVNMVLNKTKSDNTWQTHTISFGPIVSNAPNKDHTKKWILDRPYLHQMSLNL